MKIIYFEDLSEGDVFWGDEVVAEPSAGIGDTRRCERPRMHARPEETAAWQRC